MKFSGQGLLSTGIFQHLDIFECTGTKMSQLKCPHWCQNLPVPKCLCAKITCAKILQCCNDSTPKYLGAKKSPCRSSHGDRLSMCRNVHGAEKSPCQNVPLMKRPYLNISQRNVRCQYKPKQAPHSIVFSRYQKLLMI